MIIQTEGLILTEQPIKEKDKLITILTRKEGLIRCFVKGSKNLSSKYCASTQAMTFSRLSLYSGKSSYNINDAEAIELFIGLRNDLEKFSLGQYFCEVAINMIPDSAESDEFLSLILNSLYLLSNDKKPNLQIKAVFELRFLSLAGYMPDLVGCKCCGQYSSDIMYFIPDEGKIICSDCFDGTKKAEMLSPGVLTAMRTAVFADPKKIFAFSLSESSLRDLADISEKYMLRHCDRELRALAFYKSLAI